MFTDFLFLFSEKIEEKTKVPSALTGTNVVALNRINRENSRCKHILTIHSHTQIYTCVLYFCYHVFERYTSQKKIINNKNFQVFKILSLTYQKTTQRNTLQMSIRFFFLFFNRLEHILFVFTR